MIGWAMTGGQDQAAAVRRVALAAAVRVAPVRDALAATATPRLKKGRSSPVPGGRRSGPPPRVRPGSLIPNPLVRGPGAAPVRLDAILAGRTTVLTARQPEEALADLCDRYGLAAASGSARGGRSVLALPACCAPAGPLDGGPTGCGTRPARSARWSPDRRWPSSCARTA